MGVKSKRGGHRVVWGEEGREGAGRVGERGAAVLQQWDRVGMEAATGV